MLPDSNKWMDMINKLVKILCIPFVFLSAFVARRSVWCILAGYTDDESVRPAATVAEAEGANYIGFVILPVTLLPFGVIIILDLASIINNKQHRPRPPRKTKRYKKRRLVKKRTV